MTENLSVHARESHRSANRERAWRKLSTALLLLTTLLIFLPGVRLPYGLAPVDIAVAITALLFLMHFFMGKHVDALRAVPVQGLLLVLWMAISLLAALKLSPAGSMPFAGTKAGLLETAQALEYLVVVVMLYALGPRDERSARLLLLVLFAALTAVMGYAAFEYSQYRTELGVLPFHVDGGLRNRNVFGAYLCVLLPLMLGVGLRARTGGWLLWSALLCVAGLCLCTAGGLFIAIAAGLLIVCFLHRQWLLPVVALALVVLVSAILPRLPRDNAQLLYESAALYRPTDRAGAFAHKADIASVRAKVDTKLTKLNVLSYSERSVQPGDVPVVTADETSWVWQQRYKDWQAAVNMMRARPWTGVGPGGYRNVTQFYEGQPKYPLDLMEDDGHGLYFVLGSTAGLPAVVLLVWLLLTVLARQMAAAFEEPTPEGPWHGIALGAIGSIFAVLIGALFTEFLTVGIGVLLGMLLGLGISAHHAICESLRPRAPTMRVLAQNEPAQESPS